jgi:hypothetical protein
VRAAVLVVVVAVAVAVAVGNPVTPSAVSPKAPLPYPAAHAAHGFHRQNLTETAAKIMPRMATIDIHDAYVQRLRQESSMIDNTTDQG